MPPLSHITSCIHTKSKLHLTNSLAVAVSEPAIYRLITFHVPNIMSHFSLLRPYQNINPDSKQVFMFCNKATFYGEEWSTIYPTPKLEDHHLSDVRDCLFNIFTATLYIGGRSFICTLKKCHTMVTDNHLTRISQLKCVIITMAAWNNPEMNSQAKINCKQKNLVLHSLLNSSVYLQCIKKKQWQMMGIINMMIFFIVCVNNFTTNA